MIWNLIGSIGGKVLEIVDDVVEDKDQDNRLKFQIQTRVVVIVTCFTKKEGLLET